MTPEVDPPGPPITLLPETPLVLLPEPLVPPSPDDFPDPDDVPGPDDGPVPTFELPVPDEPFEVQLAYTDPDVCDYTVWSPIAEPATADVLAETTVGMESIASATDSAGYYQRTFLDSDLCDLEIRVAVEESLPSRSPTPTMAAKMMARRPRTMARRPKRPARSESRDTRHPAWRAPADGYRPDDRGARHRPDDPRRRLGHRPRRPPTGGAPIA